MLVEAVDKFLLNEINALASAQTEFELERSEQQKNASDDVR